MTDWSFAIQRAAGGFGMVFLLLTMLAVMVSVGARLIARSEKNKAERQV